jgi:hypothetical protein
MLEVPATIPCRFAVDEELHSVEVSLGPDNKFPIVDKVDLSGITTFSRIPYQRQFLTRFKLEAFRPNLNGYVDRAILVVDKGLLGSGHSYGLAPDLEPANVGFSQAPAKSSPAAFVPIPAIPLSPDCVEKVAT